MARLRLTTIQQIRKKKAMLVYTLWMRMILSFNVNFQLMYLSLLTRRTLRERYTIFKMERNQYIHRLIHEGPSSCAENLRLDKRSFYKLCFMLESRGYVQDSRHVNVVEKVAIFLHILGHHTKMRIIHTDFQRSKQSITRYFHAVLNGVLRLQGEYFKKPEPIQSDSTDTTWRHFKNCLGALDGTHIKMTIPVEDRPKYRNRKGEITTNVLGACSPDLQFQYVLTGWEGSAADGRVLRDAIYRHGLIVPTGTYYLVDAGYTNGEGFLAPFRGERYHLNDWDGSNQPTSAREYFNMMHSSARNVIERCFGILKKRWAILRSPSFYPVKTQNRIVLACCILHNYIRTESAFDQAEIDFDLHGPEDHNDHNEQNEDEAVGDHITTIGTSDAWTEFRNNLAESMFNEWNH